MNGRGSRITTVLIAMKGSIRKSHKQLYVNKFDTLDEVDESLRHIYCQNSLKKGK